MSGASIPRILALLLLAVLTSVPGVGAADGPVDAKLERLEGGKMKLSELRGQPVLLELWATWCQPCVEQAEILEGLRGELAERGIAVLAVDVGEAKGEVEDFLAEHPKEFPVLLDRGQVLARIFDVGELPALALLRADGTLATMREGLYQADELSALLDLVE